MFCPNRQRSFEPFMCLDLIGLDLLCHRRGKAKLGLLFSKGINTKYELKQNTPEVFFKLQAHFHYMYISNFSHVRW